MDESPKHAIETAFLRARYEALKESFGERVSSQTNMTLSNENGHSSVKFIQRGGSEIKADWLKTIKEEVLDQRLKDGFMIVTVYVEGMARETVSAGVDFEYHILRNGTTLDKEDDNFNDGDRICMTFQAPVNGYLAVYMLDESRAYCMLPYKEQVDGVYRIKANKQYVFFAKEYAVGEEQLYNVNNFAITNKAVEENEVCVVFSQHPFTKKTDEEGKQINSRFKLIRNVDIETFNDWLYKCQSNDPKMRVDRRTIIIKNKKPTSTLPTH
jgi:hypothetical protein